MDFSRFTPKLSQVAVFFFATVVLISETLLFHATKFVVDYVLAMTVIGCAVAGIGCGALLASRLKCRENELFGWCCGGTVACLYLSAYVLLRHPSLVFLLPATAAVFVFPSTFIARTFARTDARGTYFFDMLGAGTAIALTVFAYRYLGTEELFLLLVTVIPWFGAVYSMFGTGDRWRRIAACLLLLLFGTLGGIAFCKHRDSGALNIVRLVNPAADSIHDQNVLRWPSRLTITRTYDNLVCRIDAMPEGNRTFVTYDGFFNDNFYDYPAKDYLEYAKPHRLRFPSSDRRVVYGLVPEPRVFVIGAAADGILKTLREITPVDHIDAVEINPGIMELMEHDFLEESGRAYEGLNVQRGNALSILKSSETKYDIITLINAHSSRWLGALGPPDCLHTRENYDLYFDHLTDDGYLLFEERPTTRRGELGLKRMILTLYDCLKRRGVKDPAEHFFVWEFMSNRFADREGVGIQTGSDMYYVGMIVSLEPLRGQRRLDLLDWCELEWTVVWDEQNQPIHYPRLRKPYPAYLKDNWHGVRFGPFFDMIERGDFSELDPHFDATMVTNDRPFPSCSTHNLPDVAKMVRITSLVCAALMALIVVPALRDTQCTGQIAWLLVYNAAIGAAYFFVEIMLIQAYQSVFLSPSMALVLVLGVLLIGSALGGLAANHVAPWLATVVMCPVLFLALRTPSWVVERGLSSTTTSIVASVAVLLVGMNMGIYFPKGLLLARRWSLRNRIPHLFAINSIAGALATIASLYVGIRVGYTWTIMIAMLLYTCASILFWRMAK